MNPTRPGIRSVVAALALALALLPSTASASEDASSSARCGVWVLSQPYVAIGIGPVVTDVTDVLSAVPTCIDLSLLSAKPDAPAAAAGGCRGASRPAYRLKSRVAAAAVRCLINKERRSRGKGTVAAKKPLKKAAKKHTKRMVKQGCFAHQCPGEGDLIQRVTSTGYLPCRCSWSVGENLAYGNRKRSSPKRIVAAWMASPPHRANILNGGFEHVDVGVKRGKPGSKRAKAGTYTINFGYQR